MQRWIQRTEVKCLFIWLISATWSKCKKDIDFFSSIFSALRRSAGISRLRSSLTFWSVVLIKFRRWQVSTLYFSVSYVFYNKLLMIVIHIGRRILSAYFRFIMKKMLMQILLQNLRIVLFIVENNWHTLSWSYGLICKKNIWIFITFILQDVQWWKINWWLKFGDECHQYYIWYCSRSTDMTPWYERSFATRIF